MESKMFNPFRSATEITADIKAAVDAEKAKAEKKYEKIKPMLEGTKLGETFADLFNDLRC